MMDDDVKSILESKTFWANLLGPICLWLGTHYGIQLDPETQTVLIALVMSVMNLVLRLNTHQAVALKLPGA